MFVCMVSGCGKEEQDIDRIDIEKIKHSGTTGGKDGSFAYWFSDSESRELIELLHQVELGEQVEENKALSSGAVSYYTLYFTDGETLTLSPGQYFKIDDAYYDFKNYDELWPAFIRLNSAD